jgi:hypothetical protein
MSIYVPIGETAAAQKDNERIVQGLEALQASFFRNSDQSGLEDATSMVVAGTDLTEKEGVEATYLAERLGRDVLILCQSEHVRDDLLRRLGAERFSIMAASNDIIFMTALKTHLGAQELKRGITRDLPE